MSEQQSGAGGIPGVFFVDETPVIALDVLMPNGVEYPMHFRRLPRARFLKFYNQIEKANEDAIDRQTAQLIADCICNPDGTPAMDVERALSLTPGAQSEIQKAILRAHDMDRDRIRDRHAKRSEPAARAGSGESSPSHSGADPLPNGSASSMTMSSFSGSNGIGSTP